MIDGDPYSCDFAPQYKLDVRISQAQRTMFDWAVILSDRQQKAKKQ